MAEFQTILGRLREAASYAANRGLLLDAADALASEQMRADEHRTGLRDVEDALTDALANLDERSAQLRIVCDMRDGAMATVERMQHERDEARAECEQLRERIEEMRAPQIARAITPRPTIAELEAILNEEPGPIEITPAGDVIRKATPPAEGGKGGEDTRRLDWLEAKMRPGWLAFFDAGLISLTLNARKPYPEQVEFGLPSVRAAIDAAMREEPTAAAAPPSVPCSTCGHRLADCTCPCAHCGKDKYAHGWEGLMRDPGACVRHLSPLNIRTEEPQS